MRRKKKSVFSGVLFSVTLAAIGLGFMIFVIIPTLYEGWEMSDWQPVKASVLKVNLSDNGSNYRVSAVYRYSWQGQSYTASRIGISGGRDSVGDWHQYHYYKLQRARHNKTPITVWVNPDSPDKAIVDRDIRWGLIAYSLIFVVLFGGSGLNIIIYNLRKRSKSVNLSTPWLDNPAWRENRIFSDDRGAVWVFWFIGILLSLFMIPMWTNTYERISEGIPLSMQPFLVLLICIGVLYKAVINSLRWRRFGDPVLRLLPFPGELNGRIAGYIELPHRLNSQSAVEVRLSCSHIYWKRTGKEGKRCSEVVWQDRQCTRFKHVAKGVRIYFEFHLQNGLQPSSTGIDYHEWSVEVQAKLTGPDLDKRFTIPVYGSSGTSQLTDLEDNALGTVAK